MLANSHGPRSLKYDSNDGGLAKPASEHTYAVLPRNFLCDCQLDLKYASVLRQMSSCDEKNNKRMVMYFTVNLVFWQYLHNYQPKLARKVKLNLSKTPQPKKWCVPIQSSLLLAVLLQYWDLSMGCLKFSNHYLGTEGTSMEDVCTIYFFLYHEDYYTPLHFS